MEDVKKLEEKEIKDLVKKAIEEGRLEARFLLYLKTVDESMYRDGFYRDFRVIHGDVEIVELDSSGERGKDYQAEYIIIPKTVPVIVSEIEETANWTSETLHIFTKEGWKMVNVR